MKKMVFMIMTGVLSLYIGMGTARCKAKDVQGKDYAAIYNKGRQSLDFYNNLYHYKMSVPGDWSLDKNTIARHSIFFSSVASKQKGASELVQGMKLEVGVSKAESGVSLTQMVAGNYGGEQVSLKNIAVGGTSAIRVAGDMMGYFISTYVIKGGNSYVISGYFMENVSEYTAIYDKILTSFTFTN